MKVAPPLVVSIARAAAWAMAPVLLLATMVADHRIAALGVTYADGLDAPGVVSYLAALLFCWLVGVLLTWQVVRNAAGWTFVALATSLAGSAFADTYGVLANRADPGLPAGALAAALGESSFAWWFLLLALGLQLTPTGRPLSARWAWLTWLSIGSGVLFQLCALLRSTPLTGVNVGLVSPLAVPALAGPAAVTGAVSVVVLGLCLVASVWVVVRRFRVSLGEERRQMLWLVVGATPLPLCVVLTFAASYAGHDGLASLSFAVGLCALTTGAAFSIVKYRLYGVERIAGTAVAYAVATSAVVLAYAVVVIAITGTVPGAESRSVPLTVLATLAAAGVALPAYRWARDAIDRRFNRRRFDAVRMVRAGVAAPVPDLPVLVREALGDASARILFPAGPSAWVNAEGVAVVPSGSVVDVTRMGATAARIEFDPGRTDREIVEAVGAAASAEIDNLGLRAELARQLQETNESRARLAGAHQAERRRMERDLHDGAQQRLLAIALLLQSARVNGSPELLREETSRAIEQLAAAVHELRDLANGLQPQSLAIGGLRAAVDDLAARIPLRLVGAVVDRRFDPALESAAWFVVAEAVSNAVKHADTDEVTVTVSEESAWLRVVVSDQGGGGADPRGSGLQGLSDRVAALGGRLTVSAHQPRGTRVEAVLPCGS